jgi:hypothetical protein
MGAMIAVGGMSPPPRGTFDFLPLLIILATLLGVRLVLGIRLTWPVLIGATVAAIFLGGAIEAWGVGVPTAVAIAAGTIGSSIVHRRARDDT